MFKICYCTIQNQISIFLKIPKLQKINFKKNIKLNDRIMCLTI